MERIIEHQKQDDVDAVVLAFDMSPFYQKVNKDYKSLLTNEEKAAMLDGRVDYFIDCPFDENISQIEAEDFIKDIFVGIFRAKYIVDASHAAQKGLDLNYLQISDIAIEVDSFLNQGAKMKVPLKRFAGVER